MRSAVLFLLAVSLLPAQSFESVSVQPFVLQDDDDAKPAHDAGSMVYSNVSLKLLLVAAYGVRPDQINGPTRLDFERYDIVAKPPAGATKDQVPMMLRNLLADRFHLVVHEEIRQRQGYTLMIGPDGPKLKSAGPITGVDFKVSADHVDITGANVPAFAGMLASFMGRPVADLTEIKGSYDFRLNVSIADLKAGSPAVIQAIRELGLVLEPRTTEAKYLVVETKN